MLGSSQRDKVTAARRPTSAFRDSIRIYVDPHMRPPSKSSSGNQSVRGKPVQPTLPQCWCATTLEIQYGCLTHDQIILAMELSISADVCRRIEVDVGKSVLDRATDAATTDRRLEEMYRFVRQVVASAFRRRSATPDPLTQRAATGRIQGHQRHS